MNRGRPEALRRLHRETRRGSFSPPELEALAIAAARRL